MPSVTFEEQNEHGNKGGMDAPAPQAMDMLWPLKPRLQPFKNK